MFPFLFGALFFFQRVREVECSPVRKYNTVLVKHWIAKTMQYIDSNPETLEELMNNDHAFVEGDQIVPDIRNAVGSPWLKADGLISLPYLISKELDRKDDILSALAMVSEHTCISFHNRTDEPDYLIFRRSHGCASHLGCIGGEQPVYIGPPCKVGNICHEVLHALGFHHEHTRLDHGKYITIVYQNIMKGMERNFKALNGQTFELPYDVTSILHYGSGFFSRNGLPTIITEGKEENMGQRKYMTELDIKRVRKMYNCDAKEAQGGTDLSHPKNGTITNAPSNNTTGLSTN